MKELAMDGLGIAAVVVTLTMALMVATYAGRAAMWMLRSPAGAVIVMAVYWAIAMAALLLAGTMAAQWSG